MHPRPCACLLICCTRSAFARSTCSTFAGSACDVSVMKTLKSNSFGRGTLGPCLTSLLFEVAVDKRPPATDSRESYWEDPDSIITRPRRCSSGYRIRPRHDNRMYAPLSFESCRGHRERSERGPGAQGADRAYG